MTLRLKPEQLAVASLTVLLGFGLTMASRSPSTIESESARSAVADELSETGTDLVLNPCSSLVSEARTLDTEVIAFRSASHEQQGEHEDHCDLSLRVNTDASGSGSVRQFSDVRTARAFLDDGINVYDVLSVDRSCRSGGLVLVNRLRSSDEQSHHIVRGFINGNDASVVVVDLESSSLHDETLRDGVETVLWNLVLNPASGESE